MRIIAVVGLLLILTACATPGQAAGEIRMPTTTPSEAVAQPTAAPERAAAEPSVLTQTPTQPLAQPIATPTFESSVLLVRWNARENRHEIRLVDPLTGQEAPGYTPIYAWPYALSTNSRKLAAIESHARASESYAGGTSSRPSADLLHLIDVPAWRAVTATLPGKGWVRPVAFSPDTSHLALAYHERSGSTLMLFDTSTGQLIAQQTLTFRPSLMAFTQDGTSVAVYGQPLGSVPGMTKPDPPRVLLADAATLEVKWDQPLAGIISGDWCLETCNASHEQRLFAYWQPAVVASRDGRKLYIVHADEERLSTVDFETRSVRSVEIRVARTWLEDLLALTAGVAHAKAASSGAYKEAALSPDGTRLYVIGRTTSSTRDARGNWQVSEVSLGLQVVDAESGRKIATLDGEAKAIT